MAALHYDMPAGEYHSLRRISKSGLDLIARSPAHYVAAIREPKAPTKAMRIGTAVHALALEGKAPTVRPEFSGKGSVAARAEWDAQAAATGVDLILDADEAELVHSAAAHLAMHPIAGPALRRADGRPEVSALWECMGAECKSRFDFLLPAAIVDLKTAADASAEAFRRSVTSYRYHVQAAFYLDAAAACGLEVEHFLFVVVETDAPFGVAIYQLEADFIEAGRRAYRRDLSGYLACKQTGDWPGYPQEIQTLTMPAWADGRNEQ